MQWTAINGSWRKMNKELKRDVRDSVKNIIFRGDGIVSGGALGVDYIAIEEALKLDSTAKKIKIFLPTTLKIYSKHYRRRAKEGVITKKQANDLIAQLNKIHKANPSSLVENKNNKIVNKDTYYQRNLAVVEAADALIAFHVNESQGVKDTIEKARRKGIPTKIFTYTTQ